jgi:phosphate:Na+ symporter
MLSTIAGGVGLFLLGMILMSESLKALGGEALRRILGRFAGGRFSSILSGAGVTVLVQSSSATTLATIGFVSAGLLSFHQAVGVILGANLGTTSTGWIVSLLGLKLSIARLVVPLIAAGALLRLLARGPAGTAGMALAGFGVIFAGIDMLQAGMASLAGRFEPASFPAATPGGSLLLILIGIVMTVVLQSSSAAVTTTLAALHGGAIALDQAAALVIGQNVGTTVTAALACIGASTAARRTAVAHILFNAATAAVAVAILPFFTSIVDRITDELSGGDDALSIAAFHTAFNLLGVALFLPWTRQFAALVALLVPERGPPLTRYLDASVIGVPAVAVEAARRTVIESAVVVLEVLRDLLAGAGRRAALLERIEAADGALDVTRRFLASAGALPPDDAGYRRHLATLHAIDHLERLIEACREPDSLPLVRREPSLREIGERLCREVEAVLASLRQPEGEAPIEPVAALSASIAEQRRRTRPEVLEETAAGRIDADAAMARLEALRWVDRLAYHVWRVAHHLGGGEERNATPPAAAGEP